MLGLYRKEVQGPVHDPGTQDLTKKVGEILHVFGAYDKKMVGPRTFTKIKVYRYKGNHITT